LHVIVRVLKEIFRFDQEKLFSGEILKVFLNLKVVDPSDKKLRNPIAFFFFFFEKIQWVKKVRFHNFWRLTFSWVLLGKIICQERKCMSESVPNFIIAVKKRITLC